MPTLYLSDTLLDVYVALFAQLRTQDKMILLNRLTESMKKSVTVPENTPEKVSLPEPVSFRPRGELCGTWQDDRSVGEVIENLHQSRTPNRNFNYERIADPSGVEAAKRLFGVWSGEENRADVEQMLRAISENRMLEREVIL